MKKIKVISKSVNNKTLFAEVNEAIYESIIAFEVKWTSEEQRVSFIEVIEDYLMDMETEGKIEQTKVICDKRNNPSFSSLAKEYVLEVRFRQPGCLNVTSIAYHILNRK